MNDQATTRELEQLERTYWQAIKDQDAETCAKLTDEPCIVTGAQGLGTYTKAQMRAMMEQNKQYKLDAFELKDVKARMLTADTAMIGYLVECTMTVEGKPVHLKAADTSTWVRRNGEWACALHTETLLGDPFGRDMGAPKAQ